MSTIFNYFIADVLYNIAVEHDCNRLTLVSRETFSADNTYQTITTRRLRAIKS